MDEHFRTAPFERNLPVLMGLLSVWYTDFFGAQTVAVLPYEQYLKRFPGLSAAADDGEQRQARDAATASASTTRPGPIYWGEPGTNGQHSFYQLIHQGTRLIPCDFIALRRRRSTRSASTTTCCWPMCFAQAEALAFGKTAEEVKAEGTPDWLVPHRVFEGNRPSNTILARPPHAASARQAGRAVRAQRLHAGRRSGTSIRSTSGAWSWARCWPSASSRSWRARRSRSSSTTARPTR